MQTDLLENSNVVIENRGKITVSGVNDVESFDSECIVIYTCLGQLTVRGSGLKITGLENETGVLTAEGSIYGIVYTNDKAKSGFLGKIFK